jgi:hypothetical protein
MLKSSIKGLGTLKSSIKGISKGQCALVHVAMQFPRVDRAGRLNYEEGNLHNQVSSGVSLKKQTRIGQGWQQSIPCNEAGVSRIAASSCRVLGN